MPFKRILKELVDLVPGATGAILADWEGEAIEQVCNFDEFEMKVIGAHKGILLSRLREMHEGFSLGEIEDVLITTEKQYSLVAAVGRDYVVVMTASREALPAVALMRLRIAVELLKKEIF